VTSPWRWWDAAQIATATGCPAPAISEHWPLIAASLDRRGIYDRDVCLGVLGTVPIETASTFEPVREAYWLSEDWRRINLRYYPYFGRGYVQLTWESGYRDAGDALGLNLVGSPDLALMPTIAADILAWFWSTKGVQAKDGSRWWSLTDLCRAHDWEWTRRVVQGGTAGLDRLIAVATALDAIKEPTVTDAPIYDPDTPVVTQNHDWDCAEQATLWALTAYGRHPSDAWMEGQMLADGIESTDQGLLDGSGKALAGWITTQYGEFGYRAANAASVSFDDVRSVAGPSPVMLGGHNWGASGHWSGVRRYDAATDRLILANPGGTGPVYGQQTLSRQQFDQIAPCSMVVVTHESAVPPIVVPPAVDPRDARIAELEAQLSGLVTAIAVIADDEGDKIAAAVQKIRDIREQFLGARPAA